MTGSYIVGDAEVVQKLDGLDARLKAELRSGIGAAVLKLQTAVKKDKLSGQVLKRRTGHLRDSIGQTVEASGNIVAGIVSTAVWYGKLHEFGGTFDVKAHVRDSVASFKEVTRKGVTRRKAELLHMDKRAVGAHTVTFPERSFLRSALRDLEASGMIREEIDAAISRAIA